MLQNMMIRRAACYKQKNIISLIRMLCHKFAIVKKVYARISQDFVIVKCE